MSLVSDNGKYRDIKLFLWLIPFINAINYYLTYDTIGPLWRLLATFSVDTLMGYITWLLIRAVILRLDKKVAYESGPLRRIIIQLVLTTLTGAAATILLTELVNWLATSAPVPASFYTKDLPIISIWFFVVNGIYIGLHYYQQWQLSEALIREERKIKSGGFRVSAAKKDLLLSFDELFGFYVEGDYTVVITAEKRKYLISSSLDKVEKSLPSNYFFRINRQYIVHRQVVTGFEKGENGKITVLLKDAPPLPGSVAVSRIKAPAFKQWFGQD